MNYATRQTQHTQRTWATSLVILLGCLWLWWPHSSLAQTSRVRKAAPPTTAPPSAKKPASLPPKRYALRGKITAMHREILTFEVEHEAIAGYMEAMTMKFPVKDAKLFGRHKVGDLIECTLYASQTNGDWWLDQVKLQKKR